MKSRHLVQLLSLTIGLLLTGRSSGQVLFSDNFDSYAGPFPMVLTTPPYASVTPNPATTDAYIVVDKDTGNLFGQGTNNQVLHVFDNSSTALTRADVNSNNVAGLSFDLATLKFDFYETSAYSGTGWTISFGLTSSATASTAFQIVLNSGSPGGYALNALHTAQIVVNTSASSVSYNSVSLDSLKYDLWIDGVRVTNNGSLSAGSAFAAGDAMTAFRFTTTTAGLSQEIFVDNLSLINGAVVPEPSTLSLVLGCAGFVIFVLRGRRVRGLAGRFC